MEGRRLWILQLMRNISFHGGYAAGRNVLGDGGVYDEIWNQEMRVFPWKMILRGMGRRRCVSWKTSDYLLEVKERKYLDGGWYPPRRRERPHSGCPLPFHWFALPGILRLGERSDRLVFLCGWHLSLMFYPVYNPCHSWADNGGIYSGDIPPAGLDLIYTGKRAGELANTPDSGTRCIQAVRWLIKIQPVAEGLHCGTLPASGGRMAA